MDMIRVKGEVVLRVPNMFRIMYIKEEVSYTYYKRLQAF
jgi:hypothetical protein